MKRFLLSIITLLCICACTKGPEGESGNDPNAGGVNDNQSQSKGPITLTLESVTATTVTFSARLDVDMMADYQEVGLVWSAEDNLDVENNRVHKVKINKENYEDTFTGLAYDTDYYYTVYTLRNNVYSYGDIQTFKTNDVSITVEDISVTAVSAKISGIVERHESDDCISVGIEYSASEDFSSGKIRHVAQTDKTGEYSINISDLSFGTEYYYRKFVYQNNRYEYRDTSSFITSIVEVELSVSGITQTTASFAGNVQMIEEDNLEIGIVYSCSDTTPDVTNTKYVLNECINKDGNILCQISGFLHNTHYYFRHYIKQKSGYVYGDVKEFTTNDVEVDISIDNPTQTTAILSGHYEVPEVGVGIVVIYKRNGRPTENNYDGRIVLYDGEHNSLPQDFSIKIEGLVPGSSYEYCYCSVQFVNIWWEGTRSYYGETLKFITLDVPVTMNINNITQTTATFTGTISLTEEDILEVGLLCSSSTSDPKVTTSGVSTVVLSDIMDSDGNYSYKMEGLLNETTHYYRYYVKQGDKYTYDKVMNFKTEKVPITIDVESIDRNVVTFKGNVLFSEQSAIELGIQYYPQSTTSQSLGTQTIAVTEIFQNGDFVIKISGLLSSTEYYWQYYLLQDGVKTMGLSQTFTIADLYKIPSDLNISSATDLSCSTSANSYIISRAGLYKFKTVKGNGSESVGSVASAEILWETFGTSTVTERCDLISEYCYKDSYIVFKTGETFKEGNAVIAVKDALGNILWSWHIWFTDHPREQVYFNNAGVMMDRNLGAISATPGDVGALGLLYQWGRKDPFLGSLSIDEDIEAKSTIIWPPYVVSDPITGTVEYTITHPTTFIYCTSSSRQGDWHYSYRDNTLWTTSESTKSIYDPCPVGWRVPTSVWTESLDSYTDFSFKYNNSLEGIEFAGKFGSDITIWYPAAGGRYYSDGDFGNVGQKGHYWSTSCHDYGVRNLNFDYIGTVRPWFSSSCRANGLSVRCMKE